MDKELKPCPSCGETNKPKATNKGYLCKPCSSERAKQWYKNNPEQYFFNQLKARYGISKTDYLNMIEQQDNKCAICNKPETVENHWNKGTAKRLCVDHDHKTGLIRGLLCYRCNTTLGKMEDDTELLKNMIQYLEDSRGA
jgi:hypothetical protein